METNYHMNITASQSASPPDDDWIKTLEKLPDDMADIMRNPVNNIIHKTHYIKLSSIKTMYNMLGEYYTPKAWIDLINMYPDNSDISLWHVTMNELNFVTKHIYNCIRLVNAPIELGTKIMSDMFRDKSV